MKKDVAMFEKGVIVDFAGVEHPFVVCALSTSSFQTESNIIYITNYDVESNMYDGEADIPRAVFIGVSVCNPTDEWDEEKGKMIALSKAKGFKPTAPEKSAALFATRAGLISEPLVKALLAKEVQHITEDPGSVIKGYNQMKARYEQEQADKKYIEETPEDLKVLAEQLGNLNSEQLERVLSVAVMKSV